MTFDQLPAGSSIFLDSNILIYHFTQHSQYGTPCTELIERIENQEIEGITSTHVMAEVVHRLMTIEAMQQFGWPLKGIAARLRKHHAEIPKLHLYQQAGVKIGQLGIRVLPLTEQTVLSAGNISQAHELLTNDALIVAVMQAEGLTHLASLDADFDRIPGLVRYSPV